MTTAELATAVDTHQQSISSYETGKYSFPEDKIDALARAFRMDVIEVRRGLGLWVPEGYEPRMVSPEEAIRHDPTMSDDQRQMAIEMLALIRRQSARLLAPPTSHYDPDARPWQPGDH